MRAFANNPASSGRRRAQLAPVEFVMQTAGRYEALMTIVEQLIGAGQGNPGLTNLDSDLAWTSRSSR